MEYNHTYHVGESPRIQDIEGVTIDYAPEENRLKIIGSDLERVMTASIVLRLDNPNIKFTKIGNGN